MLLALDTSTAYASIALVQDNQLIGELNWLAGQHHSHDLFERLNWLLSLHQLTAQSITAIAVATGPGSFNGLRVALTTAKSLSFALEVPLYASPTLDVTAWGAASTGATGIICALLEAGRGEVYAAWYHIARPAKADDPWMPLNGHHLLTPDELAATLLREPAQSIQSIYFCGEWLPATQATLQEQLAAQRLVSFASPIATRRASWLAELALQQSQRGEVSDPMSLEPLYLRRPAITKSSKFALPSQVSFVSPVSPVSNVSNLSSGSDGANENTQNTSAPGGEETSHALHR